MNTTTDKEKVNRVTKSHVGFSIRFNRLLDYHPSLSKSRGRITDLSKLLIEANNPNIKNTRTNTIRNWLLNDMRPRNLQDIVTVLLEKISLAIDVETIINWLDRGDEVTNPFDVIPEKHKDVDHHTLSKIYVAVHNHARNLDIDIENFSKEVRDLIYETLLLTWNKENDIESHSDLIANLLKAASKSKK